MSWIPTPDVYFFVAGASEGFTSLNAFDGCLLNAGVGNTNLLKMSSIIPPRCRKIEPIKLPFGALVPLAYASIDSNLPGEVISAGVAAAIPEDDSQPGVIMEYSAPGHKEEIESIVREMAKKAFEMRGFRLKSLESRAIEHKVKQIGAAFAAVVLWDSKEL